MISMMDLAETVRAWLFGNGPDCSHSHVEVPFRCLGRDDQPRHDNALLRSIEKRFLAGIERVPKPAGADFLDVRDALDQRVVNRMRLAQRSDCECSAHDYLAPAGLVFFVARRGMKHADKTRSNHNSCNIVRFRQLLIFRGLPFVNKSKNGRQREVAA